MAPAQTMHMKWDKVKLRAKELRKAQTPAEQILWARLRNRGLCGLKFKRQHALGPFIADFYCAQHRLVVELDGGIHLGRAEQDTERTAQLADHGYKVLRLRNEEVEINVEIALAKIAASCGVNALLPELGEGRVDSRPKDAHPPG